MKNKILYLTLLLAGMLASCNDWLDVKPKTQVDAEEMFNQEEGFKDALTACYIKLKGRDLYGDKMTMSTVEYLAQHWDLNTSNFKEEIKLKGFDFDTDYAKNSVIAIYQGLYNTIAQTNILLENLEKKGDIILNPDVRALIEGEALAIRAFCHLDLLRLFGQVPQNATIKVNLTYAKEVTHENMMLYGFDDYVQLILADLDAAENLMKDRDPLFEYTYAKLSEMKKVELEDSFLGYRRFRFNYYAVQALKARLYMYVGDKPKAYTAAKALIDAKDATGQPVLSLAGTEDFKRKFFALPSECFLALSNQKLSDYVKELMNTDVLRETTNRLKRDIFVGQSEADNNRYIYLWDTDKKDSQGAVRPVLLKYQQLQDGESLNENEKVTKKQIIPLLRMSEIYLIAMESAPSLSEANILYQEYMRARNVSVGELSASALQEEIIREYRREFYAEGQMFYTYKRLGSKQMLWKTDREIMESDYIVPLPSSELVKN